MDLRISYRHRSQRAEAEQEVGSDVGDVGRRYQSMVAIEEKMIDIFKYIL